MPISIAQQLAPVAAVAGKRVAESNSTINATAPATTASTWTASPLETLASDIDANARTVANYLRCINYPQSSFERDTPLRVLPQDAPQDVQIAREKVMERALQLFHLAAGPSDFIENIILGYHNMNNFRWLSHFGLFDIVPLEGAIAYADAAQQAGVSESRLKSIARLAMTNHLFCEPTPGFLAHSATSAAMKTNSAWNDQRVWMAEIITPTIAKTVEAHEKWPATTKPNEAAFNYAFNTDLPMYKYIAQDPQTYQLFGRVMEALAAHPRSHIKHLANSFDWAGLGRATVVDVGGNIGHGCVVLAKNYPELSFICQDTPQVVAQGAAHVQAENDAAIAARIAFQEHDFFQEQPVAGADVYIVRQIVHNWDFDNSVKIIRNLVPALRKNSHIALTDFVLPEPGAQPLTVERVMRSRDVGMMQLFNAKERDLAEWKAIIEAADPRLRINGVNQPWGSSLAVIDVVLDC